MTDDDAPTKEYPPNFHAVVTSLSLDDPEQWPPLEIPPPPESEPEGADMCDAFMAIFGLKRVR